MTAQVRSRRVPSWVPYFNPIARRLLAAGVPMGPNALITIAGRRSGLPRTTPVTIVESSGRRWLLALSEPYKDLWPTAGPYRGRSRSAPIAACR